MNTANGKTLAIMGAGIGLSIVTTAIGTLLAASDNKLTGLEMGALLVGSTVATFFVTRAVVAA